MQLRITKGHGTGNDFVLFTDPDAAVDLTDERVRWLADRHVGVGADGVIRASRASSIEGTESTTAVCFMDYRNADGSVSEMCGNGVRVFAKYLLDEQLVEPDADGAIEIGTRAGTKRVVIGVDEAGADAFTVSMGDFTIGDDLALVSAVGLDVARPALAVDVGNPHLVVTLAEESELSRLQLAVAPQTDPEPVSGANIEFTVPGDIDDETGEITMRVHERGVGETLSCGTGAVAAAMAMRHWANDAGKLDTAPNTWLVRVPGGTLVVTADGTSATLSGPAELVFSADVTLD
ncbi:MAG: diaminopimelate epimerase [Agrococcus casei]